jgi:hypothetical protein
VTGFSQPVNTDSNAVQTSAVYGDLGDGTDGWAHNTLTADGGDVTAGSTTDAAVTNPASSATMIALLKGILTNVGTTPIYPSGSTVTIAGSGNVANASAVAALGTASGKLTYLTGFTVTGAGATAASVIAVTVAGLLGGSRIYDVVVPAGVTTTIQPLNVQFTYPLPASAVNTAITVTAAAFGSGNTNAAAVAQGFYV